MDKTTIVLITLVAYKLLLIGIGFWAQRRTNNNEDFFLGGRGLGPVVAAISYSASAASAWTLLGFSGVVYLLGVSAIWIAMGSFVGMLISWYWIGPRLMAFSHQHNIITVTDFLAFNTEGNDRRVIVILSSAIILFCFSFYVASQFQGAGNTFASTFQWPMAESVILGGAIIMIYTFLGGFWAVSVTDTVQGFLMALTAIMIPMFAVHEVGGIAGFIDGLKQVSTPDQLDLTAGNVGLMAAGLIFGSICIGIGTFGQPHLLVRFMAIRDEKALRQATRITIAWYIVVFGGMCVLGLAGHILFPVIENNESIFFAVTDRVFPPVISGLLIAAVLSAIMSTADSQLLVTASCITHDLGLGRRYPGRELLISRLTIAFMVVVSILVALMIPASIFNRVLFAWMALGSAFGPLVFARLSGIVCGSLSITVSIVTGFALAVIFYLMPNTIGDIVERVIPFTASMVLLLLLRKR